MGWVIQCVGYTYVNIDFYIERDRWWGIQTLASRGINDSGYNDSFRDFLSTYCRAGTWSYRSRATGEVRGTFYQRVQAISRSFRHTCFKPDDLTFIDKS